SAIAGFWNPDYGKGEQEDEMTGDALYKAVWEQDRMPVPYGRDGNREWKPRSVLTNHGEWLRKIAAKLDKQSVTIEAHGAVLREMAAALAARDEAIDVEALVRRIETAIESVTVRLDVPDPA